MQFFLPPQITRLLLLAAVIVAVYALARYLLVPASFHQYGFYRGAALTELASQPAVYAGHEACQECHPELVKQKAESKHKTVACESCHGPALAHAENPLQSSPEKITDPRFCLRCHAEDPARPERFPMVNGQEHFPDQTCGECHQPHAPEEAPPK